MNSTLRWMLILGCLMLAVLEAPHSSALVVEDLAGPYPELPAAQVAVRPPAPQALLARSEIPADSRGRELHTGTK